MYILYVQVKDQKYNLLQQSAFKMLSINSKQFTGCFCLQSWNRWSIGYFFYILSCIIYLELVPLLVFSLPIYRRETDVPQHPTALWYLETESKCICFLHVWPFLIFLPPAWACKFYFLRKKMKSKPKMSQTSPGRVDKYLSSSHPHIILHGGSFKSPIQQRLISCNFFSNKVGYEQFWSLNWEMRT